MYLPLSQSSSGAPKLDPDTNGNSSEADLLKDPPELIISIWLAVTVPECSASPDAYRLCACVSAASEATLDAREITCTPSRAPLFLI